MTEIVDHSERQRALDVTQSFCVTAPAGSGKTELLIQRFLALLPTVERPEQVLAITFTRKAAAEMLERVAQALAAAVAARPTVSAHERVTRQLADAALAASERGGWDLLRNLSSLNIKTIDGFCMALTRQMPVLSAFGGQAAVTDQPEELYREAVRELLSLLDTNRAVANDLKALLLHFDNDWAKLEVLLVTMLSRREQWHQYTGTHLAPEQSESQLAATVASVVTEHINDAATLIAPESERVLELLRYATGNLAESVPAFFPAGEPDQLSTWQSISELMLTAGGDWRKTVNKNQGFPTGDEGKVWKERHKQLVADLAEIEGLQAALQWLRLLPDMSHNNASWRVVQHLSHVLPVLAACLLVVFQRRGAVDYSQVARSALDALGDDDAPTELALRLDYRLEHILVDEFQDTAINQYQLVTRLSRGWGEHNALNADQPRTLFVVGDGMQSIYGFRDASVGLFLKARNEGFNGVALEPLQLRSNFRSRQGIVNWVNTTFKAVFPTDDNPRRGRVGFSEAVAVKPAGSTDAVAVHGFLDPNKLDLEAQFIASAIAETLVKDPDSTVAILGRGRSQLRPVLAALRKQGISYAAQDIDVLSTSASVLDLMSLCRALANPSDQVAWFALLRAPWCGLALESLLAVAKTGGKDADSLGTWRLVLEQQLLQEDDHRRLSHLVSVLQWARHKRDRLGLRAWIESTWLRLGGPSSLSNPGQLRDAEVFLNLLDKAGASGAGLSVRWLTAEIEKLYAASDDPDARVVAMTLHKAKGLEFDHVYIPAMAARTRSGDRDILMWDEYVSPEGERGFLLAADDHSQEGSPSLYNYLRNHEKEKARQETIRLLYVGSTRAVKQLTLSATLETKPDGEEPKPPSANTLLAPIWEAFERTRILHKDASAAEQPVTHRFPQLRRLREMPIVDYPEPAEAGGGNIPERPDNQLDRILGTTVHKLLEELAAQSPLPSCIQDHHRPRLAQLLAAQGLTGQRLVSIAEQVVQHVDTVLADEAVGHWLLDCAHPESQCELPVTWVDDAGDIRDSIIDRSFVDRATGERWIIDYKTSGPSDGESLEHFSARELLHYRDQLAGYRVAMAGLDNRPIRCALYFTGISHLAELDT